MTKHQWILTFLASFILVVGCLFPSAGYALETQDGDSCTAGETGYVRKTGGPENAGVSETLICNGTIWEVQAGLSGPAGCANIGDLCADGTVFIGWHPNTHTHLFIPTADQEQPGSPGTFTMTWKNANGTDDITPDSRSDAPTNHTNRGGVIGDFHAFKSCEDLSFGGHGDWYLPSQVEIYYIWSIHETIEAGGNITNFVSTFYWSSTENSTVNSWAQYFVDGKQYTYSKINTARVRCIRYGA